MTKSPNKIDKFIDCIIEYGKIHNFNISNEIDKSNNIENLRKFHNYIKSNLIINSCLNVNAKNLLDIACGRGGDLQKWLNHKLKLKYILAFDTHPESIYSSIRKGDTFDGAIARFQNIKNNYKGTLPFINFQNLNILDPNIYTKINNIDKNKIYDVVSCQFALHYFSESFITLNNTISIVSQKLKKGGLFIGTATDGDRLYKILKNGNVNIPLLTLIKSDHNFKNYLFHINTTSKTITRQNYFEFQGASSEFYLFKYLLVELCKKHNLELIEFKSFYDWYQNYKFEPSFKPMSIYEMIISFLNFSFIFIKI